MTPTLETARLLLTPLQLADAEFTQRLFPHWEIVRFLDARVPWPYPADGAHTFYRDVAVPAIERGEAWHWMLRLKTAPEQVIGSVALMKGKDNRGFWIGLPWQRQGLMSEACDVVTDFWFNELGFPVLRVAKAIDNLASRRISEKQGMRVVGYEERQHVSGLVKAEVWEITAEVWRARRSRCSSLAAHSKRIPYTG
jgi:RimJ/RimL family protein N-acetyltransferase